MHNPSTSATDGPSSGPQPLSPEGKAELARQRAAAADAWRAYVESGAVVHRQRREFLETQFQLALGREQKAGAEITRLEQIERRLNGQVAHWQHAYEALTPAQAIRRALRKKLEQYRWGAMLLNARSRRGAPPNAPSASSQADAGCHEAAPQHTGNAALVQLQPGGRSVKASAGTVLFITGLGQESPLGRYGLDLLDALASQCNITVWHLGQGALLPQFQAAASTFVAAPEPRHNYPLARQFVAELLRQQPGLEFAVVMGEDILSPLPALAEHYLPVIGILDEHRVHASPYYALEEALFWHTHTVFTNTGPWHAVQRLFPHVNPQCASVQVPGPGSRSLPVMAPGQPGMAHLPAPLRGGATPPDAVIVGWGPATYSAGIDLFVACADAIRQRAPGKRYHFLWLVQAASELPDPACLQSVYGQIEHLGLQEHLSLVFEPLSESLWFEWASLAIFPARDNLIQHTGVYALQHGMPLVAFSGLTALATAMQQHGLEPSCLARPGNVNALADKALSLLENPNKRQALSQQLASLNWHALGLQAQSQALLAKGRALQAQCHQEQADEAVIGQSGQLRPDYMGYMVEHADTLECSPARLYVRGWKAGVGGRKPRPGFLPQVYASHALKPGSLEDPFAHYLRSGCPAGPWQRPVIVPASSALPPLPSSLRVALHIHAYYPNMLEDVLARLALNRHQPHLFISVKDETAQAQAQAVLQAYPGTLAALQVVPNRGRDIGPFLTTFGPALVRDYDIVGHLHTKASHHADQHIVGRWRNFLLENLVGGPAGGPMMDTILSQLAENPDWGIAFPDDPLPLGWDTNKPCAEAIARHLMPGSLPEHFCFPAGTMFWIRANALRPFVQLGLGYNDYPEEPLPVDGSLLHALERLFGVVPPALGMQCALVSTPGLSR